MQPRTINTSSPFFIATCVVVSSMLLPLSSYGKGYLVQEISALSQDNITVVRGVNNQGVAVGTGKINGKLERDGDVSAQHAAFIFSPSGVQKITGVPNSDHTVLFGINDMGFAVGTSNSANSSQAFVVGSSGKSSILPALPGHKSSTAMAVNNLGQIAGFSTGKSGEKAVLWDAQQHIVALPGPPSKTQRAFAINAHSTAVGVYDYGLGRRAARWENNATPQLFPLLPGDVASEAHSINSKGETAGFSSNSSYTRHAVKWNKEGKPFRLEELTPQSFSQAFSINDTGQVVGMSSKQGVSRAVLWSNSNNAIDLNTVITPAGFTLTKAVGINNAGAIMAVGHDNVSASATSHEDHELPTRIFLLTPSGD